LDHQLLAMTWPDSVKEKNDDGCFPLHSACSCHTLLIVIQFLVETWPDAVKEKTNDGNLPLHNACRYNEPVDVIQLLVKTWPDAVKAFIYLKKKFKDTS
jgi:ankyrin repeat protein